MPHHQILNTKFNPFHDIYGQLSRKPPRLVSIFYFFFSSGLPSNPLPSNTLPGEVIAGVRPAIFRPRKLIPFPGTNGYPKYDDRVISAVPGFGLVPFNKNNASFSTIKPGFQGQSVPGQLYQVNKFLNFWGYSCNGCANRRRPLARLFLSSVML